MIAPTIPRHRLAAAMLGLALVAGACGGSAATAAPATPVPTIAPAPATPTPAPTATPTVAPTPTPTVAPTPTPAATASAAIDPAAGIAIAAPYELAELDAATAAALKTSIEQGMGAFAGLIHVGIREATKSGVLAAYVMVMAFPPGALTAATYKAVVAGFGASSTAAFKPNDVSGTTVSTGTLSTVNVGVYQAGDTVMLVLAAKQADILPIAKALITAN